MSNWVSQFAHTARLLHSLSVRYRMLAKQYPNSSMRFPDYEARYRDDAYRWLAMARRYKAGPLVLPVHMEDAA